jgi:hypothetical protein
MKKKNCFEESQNKKEKMFDFLIIEKSNQEFSFSRISINDAV